jgi:hypothetical protein
VGGNPEGAGTSTGKAETKEMQGMISGSKGREAGQQKTEQLGCDTYGIRMESSSTLPHMERVGRGTQKRGL